MYEFFSSVLAYSAGGNTVQTYLQAIGTFIALFGFFTLLRIVYRKLRKAALKTETVADDVIVTILGALNLPFYSYLSFFGAMQVIWKPHWFENVLLVIMIIFLTYECLRVVQEIIQDFSVRYGDHKRNLKAAVSLISIVIILLLWIVGGAIILANLGIDPTTLIAGLGIGGIALAFAVQNVVGDIFNYFSIRMDNPITEGDFVNVQDKSGYVSKIGIKSTRLKSLTGEEVIISNKDLVGNKLENYGKAEKRGSIFSLHLSIETTAKQLELVPQIIERHIRDAEKTEFVRSHVTQARQTGFMVETYYKVQDHDFITFRNIHQKVLLGVLAELEANGYKLATASAVVGV